LQRRMRPSDRVDLTDELGETVRPLVVTHTNLVFLGVEILFAPVPHRDVLREFESTVNAIRGAERSGEHQAYLESRAAASLQVRMQDVGRVGEEIRTKILTHRSPGELGEILDDL